MIESNFKFVKNKILRQNIDEAFDYIVLLLPFTESKSYDVVVKGLFRKTIIIYTASIIEALLFYVLNLKFTNKDLAAYTCTWELKEKKVLYVIDKNQQIIAGNHKKIPGKIKKDKMNLGQIIDFLKEKQVISKELHEKVDVVRELRNGQHIGSHKIVKNYSKADLEKTFLAASEVKNFVRGLSK